MGVETVIGTYASGTYTILRTARGVYINGRYQLPQSWAALTTYAIDTIVTNNGRSYQVTTAGESDSSIGPTGTGSAITDGSVVWEYLQDNSFPILASIRPKEGRELKSDSEGEYSQEECYVVTTTPIYPREPGNPDTESDIIQIANRAGVIENWEITSVRVGRTFVEAIATRLPLP